MEMLGESKQNSGTCAKLPMTFVVGVPPVSGGAASSASGASPIRGSDCRSKRLLCGGKLHPLWNTATTQEKKSNGEGARAATPFNPRRAATVSENRTALSLKRKMYPLHFTRTHSNHPKSNGRKPAMAGSQPCAGGRSLRSRTHTNCSLFTIKATKESCEITQSVVLAYRGTQIS